MSTASIQLKNVEHFRLLKKKVGALRYERGVFFIDPKTQDVTITPPQLEKLKREWCKFLIETKNELFRKYFDDELSEIDRRKLNKMNANLKQPKQTIDNLLKLYFPEDCGLLNKTIKFVVKHTPPEEENYYEYLFDQKHIEVYEKIKKSSKKEHFLAIDRYVDLFNCRNEYKKVLQVFDKKKKSTVSGKSGKTTRKKSRLSRVNSSASVASTRSSVNSSAASAASARSSVNSSVASAASAASARSSVKSQVSRTTNTSTPTPTLKRSQTTQNLRRGRSTMLGRKRKKRKPQSRNRP